MENYIFTPKEIILYWPSRLYSYYVSIKDKQILYKHFVTELHLDKLHKDDISFNLPNKYHIDTNEINRLYNTRDDILSKMYDKDYTVKQIAIDDKTSKLTEEQQDLKASRTFEKKNLSRLQTKLRNTNDSADYIALESNIATTKAKIKNTEAAISHCQDQIKELKSTKKENCSNWKKQTKLIERTIESSINKHIKRATRKIELTYGFTDYTHTIRKYGEDYKKIIKGEYYDKKTSSSH